MPLEIIRKKGKAMENICLNKGNLAYFEKGKIENKKFFDRLNGEPDFR
jgi:hypothetical protein